MKIDVVTGTDRGLVRTQNEDCFYSDPEAGLFAVADGVGGGRAGETASKLFCDVVAEHSGAFQDHLKRPASDQNRRPELLSLMSKLFYTASERIYRLAESQPRFRGMATTGMVLAIGGGIGVLGHVGDSRLYLIRDQKVRQLTIDHTLAQEMINQGILREEDVESFPHHNVLARAVGQFPTVRTDTLWLDISPGDNLLMCSDGLYRYFSDIEMAQIPFRGMNWAIQRANERGGHDNITGVVVRVNEADETMDKLDTTGKVQHLQNLFLFQYLTFQELVRVLKFVFEQHYDKDDFIFREGEPGESIHMVFDGMVEIRSGEQSLHRIGPGGHFGEIAFMDGRPRSATVVALKPTSILTIQRDDFLALTRTDPVIATKLLWCFVLNMSERLRSLSADIITAREL